MTRLSTLSAAVTLTANTSNQAVVAAPGEGKAIWVYGIYGGANTGAGTIAFQDEDDVALTGAIPLAANGQLALVSPDNSRPLFKVPENKALEADTATLGFAGLICYSIQAV